MDQVDGQDEIKGWEMQSSYAIRQVLKISKSCQLFLFCERIRGNALERVGNLGQGLL